LFRVTGGISSYSFEFWSIFQDHEKKANLVEDKEVKMEPDLLIAIKEKEDKRSWYISW
jgi:hypothetical protein